MMNSSNYTYCGNKSAEKVISSMLNTIAMEITKLVPEKYIRSLVLIGGYGKGEGGVIERNGLSHPHNNFDFILVTKNSIFLNLATLSNKLNHALDKLSKELDIGIDISVMTEAKVRSMPTRVLWYDMKEGHRVIYGDSKFISSINHLRRNIPNWDMRNLMVNRGSLLLINTLCLQAKKPNTNIRKLIIKHTMKAIIGYGDAVLYFLGQYHWSYKEKLVRILSHADISIQFKRLYHAAINFRVSPNYQYYLEKDLGTWQQEICKQLNSTHITCESIRLNKTNLNWDNYLERALSSLIQEQTWDIKSLCKLLINTLKPKSGKLPGFLSFKSKLAYRISSEEAISPLLFPYLIFNPVLKDNAQSTALFISSHFGASDFNSAKPSTKNKHRTKDNLLMIIKSYLSLWGKNFDPNLWHVLKKNHILL